MPRKVIVGPPSSRPRAAIGAGVGAAGGGAACGGSGARNEAGAVGAAGREAAASGSRRDKECAPLASAIVRNLSFRPSSSSTSGKVFLGGDAIRASKMQKV